jgi:hypothetical protein
MQQLKMSDMYIIKDRVIGIYAVVEQNPQKSVKLGCGRIWGKKKVKMIWGKFFVGGKSMKY